MSAKRNVVPRSQAESSGSSVQVLTNRGSINEGTANTSSRIIEQCLQWVTIERDKKAARRDRRKNRRMGQTNADDDASSGDEALNVLDSLLQQLPVLDPPLRVPMKRRRTLQKRRSLVAMASDSEYGSDGEVVVPECEEWLKMPEEIGWNEFKLEVLKLTHTLRCKGWRRVELERYKDIDIEKISGALTNAVSLSQATIKHYADIL
jgi:choline kinase